MFKIYIIVIAYISMMLIFNVENMNKKYSTIPRMIETFILWKNKFIKIVLISPF